MTANIKWSTGTFEDGYPPDINILNEKDWDILVGLIENTRDAGITGPYDIIITEDKDIKTYFTLKSKWDRWQRDLKIKQLGL